MKVTISDVAKLAGVSTATVSHTINNTRYVSSETKEKVYSAIAELGYTPDASARSFRTGKKKTVGFIVPDISNKFFATMIESVENYLSMHGYHLIIANTKEDMDREETNVRLLTAGLVDGLLIASTMDDFGRFDQMIPAGSRWCWWTGLLRSRSTPPSAYPTSSPFTAASAAWREKGTSASASSAAFPACPVRRSVSAPISRRWRTADCRRTRN